MGSKKKVKKPKNGATGEEDEDAAHGKTSKENAREHMEQLQRLKEKQADFYEFLKETDPELLQFTDGGIDDDAESDMSDSDIQEDEEDEEDDMDHADHHTGPPDKDEGSRKVITSAMVDSWCSDIEDNAKLGAVRSIMKAFRTACHYGDDNDKVESATKLTTMSSAVFNKVMLVVLTKMDGILRTLLNLPAYGGKKETIIDLMKTKAWKNYNHLVKSYLGNALHVLNQMTDTEMIAFTLRRLKYSALFLAAFPALLRKYIKVVLHFWGTGGGALPMVSFLFLRDLCIRLGSDCVDVCFRGIYKAYVLNCHFVNVSKLQQIHFLRNCVIELFRVDLPAAYQHAFVFIRQLATILREALDTRTKEAFRKVYEWKYINCLELWTGAICAYGSEADFRPLAYPLTQIISGVARLVPTARYFPLRLRCIRMLNQIAASTNSFIPVAIFLLDMLDMKELNKPPTGGVGKAVDLRTILKVNKTTIKTRSFQEACVYSVVEELAEHLAQWSYSAAFFELSFVPSVRLRDFCKSTKVERFRREMRQLIHEIEANSEFTNESRKSISYLPNEPAVASFLEDEKKSGTSPLSRYVVTLRQRAQQRNDSLMESSVLVGERTSVFGKKTAESDEDDDDDDKNDEGAAVFSSSWLPTGDHKIIDVKEENGDEKKKKKKEKKNKLKEKLADDEDVVEDLVLSSDEEVPMSDTPSDTEDVIAEPVPLKQQSRKQKPYEKQLKRKMKGRAEARKRKRSN